LVPRRTGAFPSQKPIGSGRSGAWLKVNGEAIYGTGPTAFGDEAGAFSATEKDPKKGRPALGARMGVALHDKPGKIYIHIFKWPGGKFVLTGVKGTDRQGLSAGRSAAHASDYFTGRWQREHRASGKGARCHRFSSLLEMQS